LALSSNKHIRFCLNFIILIIFLILTDQVAGGILRYFYFKQESGLLYRTTYAIDSTKADIIVLGSSRANHHYVPQIFRDCLKKTFYNAGREGSSLLYNYAVFKAIINRYTPELVIFDLNPNELYYESGCYDRLSALLPYYKKHTEIRNIVNLKSRYEQLKLVSAIYPFNSLIFTIGIGNLEINKLRKGDSDGYIPLKNILSDSTLTTLNSDFGRLDTNKTNSLKDIMRICKLKNISLYLIESPIYASIENDKSTSFIEQLAIENNIYFLNYNNHKEFIRYPAYFQDRDHLNDKGADFFSNLIVQKIKELQRLTN
jgi:hypothetical protein